MVLIGSGDRRPAPTWSVDQNGPGSASVSPKAEGVWKCDLDRSNLDRSGARVPRRTARTTQASRHRHFSTLTRTSRDTMMCTHSPRCPDATDLHCCSAHVEADHSEQGWCRLCNGVILFDD